MNRSLRLRFSFQIHFSSFLLVPTPVQPEGIVLSTGAIVGIVIGALVVILAVFVIVAVSIVVIVQKKKHPNNVSRYVCMLNSSCKDHL